MKENIKSLFISDVHLGSKGSNAKMVLKVLKKYKPEELFIVGDFIDGWLLKRRNYWTQDYTNLVRKILSYSKKGTKITYITGNHDDFLREYVPLELENIHRQRNPAKRSGCADGHRRIHGNGRWGIR